MAIGSISPAGSIGIVKDVPPAELPLEAWSDGSNVRFRDGVAETYADAISLVELTPVQFSSAIPGPVSAAGFATWVLGSAEKLYSYAANVLTDVTRISGDYVGATLSRWSGGVLAGVTIVNNGVEAPQAWLTPETTTNMVDLPNWPSGVTASCLRVYKQHLVALNITKAGTNYPTMVKWSHPADPGTVPVSWDEADPTKDAGEWPLSETAGACVDAVPLRDTLIIYKQDSVWAMQYIGGTFIFKFLKIFGDFGAQGRDCAVEYQSGRHCVFTGNDLVIHDGQTAQSVVNGKLRSMLKTFSTPQLQSAYLVLHSGAQEVWLCFRKATDSIVAADTALTYNWSTGALGLLALDQYPFAASGRVDPPVTGVTTWDSVGALWDGISGEWGESVIIPSRTRILAIGTEKLVWLEAQPFSSQACFLERTHMGVQFRAAKSPDLATQKFIRRVWPRITGTKGDVVFFTFGTADDAGAPIDWEPPLQFIIGVDTYLDPILAGKLFAVRISSLGTAQWIYSGMDVDVTMAGEL